MAPVQSLKLFEDSRIRALWDEREEEWYFSIVDVVSVLSATGNPRRYWSDLKRKLEEEGSQVYDFIVHLKLRAPDGKMRATDCATTQGVLRIIQSIPSPKAEPFKLWLAQVGAERIEETIDPEQAIDRALETYLKKGYSPEWVNQRLQAISVRKELTDEWVERGVSKDSEFAILTDEISKAWAGMTTRQYKNHKGLTKENLRDNMSTLELVLNMLAEATTTELSKTEGPETFAQSKDVARRGGSVAGNARREIESQTGKPVITSKNAQDFKRILGDVIEATAEEVSPSKESGDGA
ncbi:BRO family protein [Arabiibacter massiliensis]|uniref:BRO family protein n=1 Tax=Arabiibacter massiliensis TaxID=1870985 RepID=UPI0009BA18BD|nr:BRO family protein [Arabiibacter massiliensis]